VTHSIADELGRGRAYVLTGLATIVALTGCSAALVAWRGLQATTVATANYAILVVLCALVYRGSRVALWLLTGLLLLGVVAAVYWWIALPLPRLGIVAQALFITAQVAGLLLIMVPRTARRFLQQRRSDLRGRP